MVFHEDRSLTVAALIGASSLNGGFHALLTDTSREVLQHGIVAHRQNRLEDARLGAELVPVHAASRSLAPRPDNAAEDDQTHGTGVVEQNRPTDREFHECSHLQRMLDLKGHASAGHVNRLSHSRFDYLVMFQKFVTQVAMDREAH